MEPNLLSGKVYYFNKIRLGLKKPFMDNRSNNRFSTELNFKRGDVAAFFTPESVHASFLAQFLDVPLTLISAGLINLSPRKLTIRRVIGFAGDSVEIRDKQIYINNKSLQSTWEVRYGDSRIIPERISLRDNMRETFVPAGFVWVLSDNWDSANDSRTYGPVPLWKLEGILISKR